MSTAEAASLIASIVSISIAIGAVAMAMVFYRWSSEQTRRNEEAASAVGASVAKLEDLFSRLYSDTFSMMKDTVSDMRRAVWPEQGSPEQETQLETRLAEVQRETMERLSELVDRQSAADQGLETVRSELQTLLESTISETSKATSDVRTEEMTDRIVATLHDKGGRAEAQLLLSAVVGPHGSLAGFFEALRSLRREHQISYDQAEGGDVASASTLITLSDD